MTCDHDFDKSRCTKCGMLYTEFYKTAAVNTKPSAGGEAFWAAVKEAGGKTPEEIPGAITMEKTVKLWQRFPISEAPVKITGIEETYCPPTETVVMTPQFVQPDLARVYRTDKFWYKGRILDYKAIDKLREVNRDLQYDQIVLVEYWEDYGDDGHIEYTFQDVILTTANEWKKLKAQPEHRIDYKLYCKLEEERWNSP